MMNEIPDVTNERGFLDAALWYAAAGYRVFPLKKDDRKEPGITDWPNDASSLPTAIRSWWRGAARLLNIGVTTGHHEGLLVVDLDVKHGINGTASLRQWQEETGIDLPTAPIVRTPSGGQHLWYRLIEPCKKAVGWLPGVDIQADRGFIVAPPSVIELPALDEADRELGVMDYRCYELESGSLLELPLAPRELIAAVNRDGGRYSYRPENSALQAGQQRRADVAKLKRNGFRLGERDSGFQSLAWTLVLKHYPHIEIVRQIAFEVWNETDNPPGDPFPWGKVEEKLNRAWSALSPRLEAERNWARNLRETHG